MLTAKQEKFVRNLIEGMSQREAYKNSYDAENMTDKTIDEKACLLFATDKIRTRYRELQEELAKASILSATQRAMILSQIATDKEQGTADKIRAIDTLNKMSGEYVQKIDANVNQDVTISIELSDD